MEFGEDDGEAYTQTRRINLLINDTGFGSSVTASAVPTQSSTPVAPSRLYGKEARALHYKVAQHLLRKVLAMVVKELFPGDSSYLQNVTILTKIFWVRFCKKFHDSTSPTILDLYVLIFLAMRQLNQHPIYIDDFLRLLKTNKVPFINAATLIPASYLRQLNLAQRLFSANSIPINDLFHRKVGTLASVVAPINQWRTSLELFYPGAFKVFIDLKLQDAPCLLTLFHRIGHRITEGYFNSTWKNVTSLPETQYVALLHLVIKLYFAAAPDVPDLDKWIEFLSMTGSDIPCFNTKIHSMPFTSMIDMSKEKTSKYFDWIQNNLIPENRKLGDSVDIPQTTKKLYEIFSLSASEEPTEVRKSQVDFIQRKKNTLSPENILMLEEKLLGYLCVRFGLTRKTLVEATQRMELSFYKALKADDAIIR